MPRPEIRPAETAADAATAASGLPSTLDRRRLLAGGFAAGASAVLAGRLSAEEQAAAGSATVPTADQVAACEPIADLAFTAAERELMLPTLAEQRAAFGAVRQVPLPNAVVPALAFAADPPGRPVPQAPAGVSRRSRVAQPRRPADLESLAFRPVTELARLVESGAVRSVELTEMYLDRLARFGPLLECVVTLTPERARERAERADLEIAAGRYRGPLHGIPWGAKDLLAVAGYPTTWGAGPYRDQTFDQDATAVARLDEAGAVLVAKLTLGELAWGDVWFGGRTRNPWKIDQGSSGSSAGSASAVAAGLVGFAVGSETWGSIVSPSARCGTTGLRPTFGRVSRHGAMALSWSMDKLGPIARSVEDCALVLEAIHGADGLDPTAVARPFHWDAEVDPRRLRVAVLADLFAAPPEKGEEESHAADQETLVALADLGVELHPIRLPGLPVDSLSYVLSAEAAAAFDELTRGGGDDRLVRQVEQAWPNVLRAARLIPAVEYLQANRVRTLLQQAMAEILAGFDAWVSPSFGGSQLLLTNLTGHPCVVVPNGFRADGTPTSVSFLGNLWREDAALALAKLYQDATGFHERHPDLEAARAAKGVGVAGS